jgi:hypothetical protein
MKVTITGFINFKPKEWEGANEFHFHSCKLPDCGFVAVMPHTIEVDIPDDFDPRAKQVELLKAEKNRIMGEFQARVTAIERKISELTSIEFEVPA